MKNYWVGALFLMSAPSWAILPFGATPAEQAMCAARVGSRLDRSDPNSGHMHHYCDGLRFLDRAYASMGNKKDMQHYLNESIQGFDYVLSHTQESYAMRGEVHIGKARALKLMGRKVEAASEFNKALRYKLDSPDVYLALADHYHETGNRQKALEVTIEGLKRNPNSKGLKRRYTEFGGKLPYPEAIAEQSIPAAAPQSEIKTEAKIEAAPSPEEATDKVSGSTGLTQPAGPAPQSEAAKIGSPKNPYCRFCPD